LAKVLPALDFAESDLLVDNVLPALLTVLDGLHDFAISFSFLTYLTHRRKSLDLVVKVGFVFLFVIEIL